MYGRNGTFALDGHASSVMAFARARGSIRAEDLLEEGVPRVYLSRMVRSGQLVRVARGVYRAAEVEPTEFHTLVQVASQNSKAVICLLSALAFHNVGTQNPFEVWVALPEGARRTKFAVRTRVFHLGEGTYGFGIEKHLVEGVAIPVYSVAKTIVDCFRFRNRIGVDVAIEALREGVRGKWASVREIREFAEAGRMMRVMQPYLESM